MPLDDKQKQRVLTDFKNGFTIAGITKRIISEIRPNDKTYSLTKAREDVELAIYEDYMKQLQNRRTFEECATQSIKTDKRRKRNCTTKRKLASSIKTV